MSDEAQWPRYPVGPKDSVYAIGIISANYSRLESVAAALFAAITGSSSTFTSMLFPKLPNHVRIELMKKMLESNDWPDREKDGCDHFICAFDRLEQNRGLLMHSSFIPMTPEHITLLYKTTKQGHTQISKTNLSQLRQIADDMMTYFQYGMAISNMINFGILHQKRGAGDLVFHAWPDKPPPPTLLEYTSGPLPLT
jgi:hypothetical protein